MKKFNFKKIAVMSLAAMAAVSAMSISASAGDIPTYSKVDTTLATQENPVKYIDEATGVTVTIYDPNISVTLTKHEVEELLPFAATLPMTDSVYIKKGDLNKVGNRGKTFTSSANGNLDVAVTSFSGGPQYNVSLNEMEGSSPSTEDDAVKAVLENLDTNTSYLLEGLNTSGTFYCRFSTWGNAGNASYRVKND